MYAVIETGGKQYRVELGSEIEIDRLEAAPGETIELGRVLLLADGDEAEIGRPVVDGATVSASVVRQDRGDKIVVFKYRPKARRRVKHGHRQDLTVVRVSDIEFNGRSAAQEAEAEARQREAARQAEAEEAARKAAADRELAARLEREQKAAQQTEAEEPKPSRRRGRTKATAAAEKLAQPAAEPAEESPESTEQAAEPTEQAGEPTDEGTEPAEESPESPDEAKSDRQAEATTEAAQEDTAEEIRPEAEEAGDENVAGGDASAQTGKEE